MSFIDTSVNTVNKNLDELDPSFMYTMILKEILLTIDFKSQHSQEFIAYCREQFENNPIQLAHVDKLDQEYRRHTPSWWYLQLFPLFHAQSRSPYYGNRSYR